MLKKGDIIAIISVLAAAAVCFGVFFLFHRGTGKTVTVKQDNEIVYQGALTADKTVTLSGNTVVIADEKVRMSEADCKNQICVRHSTISKKGESIVCLPNRVIVTVE